MASNYRVFLSAELLDEIPKSGIRRELIHQFIRDLGGVCYLGGDTQVCDPLTLRSYEISLIAGFALTWWIDGPVREVKILHARAI